MVSFFPLTAELIRARNLIIKPPNKMTEEQNDPKSDKGVESSDLSDEQIEFAEALGSFLWESSTLRHGLFTPPEFSCLVKERIKQYLYEQNGKQPHNAASK